MINFKYEIAKKISETVNMDSGELMRIYRSSKRKKHGRLRFPMF